LEVKPAGIDVIEASEFEDSADKIPTPKVNNLGEDTTEAPAELPTADLLEDPEEQEEEEEEEEHFPTPIEQLHDWLYEATSKEFEAAVKNIDKIKWLKIGCLIETLSECNKP